MKTSRKIRRHFLPRYVGQANGERVGLWVVDVLVGLIVARDLETVGLAIGRNLNERDFDHGRQAVARMKQRNGVHDGQSW